MIDVLANLFFAVIAAVSCLGYAQLRRKRWTAAADSPSTVSPNRRPLTAGLTGALTSLAVSYEHLVASVLDLAARGHLNVELVTVDDDPAGRVWWHLIDTTHGQLWSYETVLLTELKATPGPAEFPSINNRSAQVVTRALWDDLAHVGCITGSPTRARATQLRLSAAAATIGVVSLLSSAQFSLGVGIGLGLLTGSAVLAKLSPRQALTTAHGQEEQHRARTRTTTILEAPYDPDSDLATAVALGVGDTYITTVAKTGAPIPSWLRSRTYTITWDHVHALVEQPAHGWPLTAGSISGAGH